MTRIFRWLSGQVDARSIRSDLVTAAIIAACSGLVYLWGWWTNQLALVWSTITGSIPVPLWIFILLATVAVGTLVGLYRRYCTPAYVRGYLTDTLDGITWAWGYDRSHQIINATPRCPTCQTRVTITPYSAGIDRWHEPVPPRSEVYCPTCNRAFAITGTDRLWTDHALPKIERRIRTGEWRQAASLPG